MNDDPSPNLIEKNLNHVEGARDADRSAGEQVREAGATTMNAAKDVGQEARDTAKSVLGTLKDQARSAAEAQKTRVADGLASVAEAVHRSGESLEGQPDWLPQLMERGADEMSQLAGSLRGADVRTLMTELSGFARREPALFLGASIALGFGLTRMGRLAVSPASSSDRSVSSLSSEGPAQSLNHGQVAAHPHGLAQSLRPDLADAANVVDPQGVEFDAGPVAEANRDIR